MTKKPLYRNIMEYYIHEIETGQLLPGERLLPERAIAKYFSVNRSTVVRALDELQSLGWITRKQGSGTKVADGQLGNRRSPLSWLQNTQYVKQKQEDPYLTKLKQQKNLPDTLDLFSGDLPDTLIPDFSFPAMSWETILKQEQQTTTAGYAPLLDTLLTHVHQRISPALKIDQLMITSGATQGLSLILQTLLAPGSCVATEDPSFLFALPFFATLNIHLKGLPQDSEGILPTALENLCQQQKIDLLYLNPTHQNPTGRTMSLNRRKQIVKICQMYHIPIVEDDVFGELNFTTPPTKFIELAPEQVIYLGSLSKLFSPLIHIGWIIAPKRLITSFLQTKEKTELTTDIFPQLFATVALNDPSYTPKQIQLLEQLEKRSQQFTHFLDTFSEWEYQKIEGGIYYWITYTKRKLTRKDWQLFLDQQILLAPAFLFSHDTIACRINYTRMNTQDFKIFQTRFSDITTQLGKDDLI
ncbi:MULTISPECIES: PLP-dependent aminotransferase family protein [Enterococcus]|uniref:HTH gntR-type domain-containing protein n=1 Tax=Enterococcus sulfureus ATCC 49903 TaxID=1140003 RepID=S0KNR1_9ENTE|nr:PLP-dependent aminotransferase family protein [Enterococcus sulfureus]EOT46419.1 hypothetical protein OMY_01566 [Enterococcus sulfureus ATCC 49903]EOT86268.1 hypothetical protein I573_01023 [Enterococcus sulfureus ATCC 49903]